MISEFEANILSIFGAQGDSWLKIIPKKVENLRKIWDLDQITTVPHLSYSYCFFAENRDKQKIVVKISPDKKRFKQELNALQSFLSGVPKVLSVSLEDQAYAMERILPGTTLKSLVEQGKDDEATRILAGVIRNLKPKNKLEGFKHVSDFIPSLTILKTHLSPYTFEKIRTLFHNLCRDRTQDLLLHGDLHHTNVLSHGNGWLAIDPYGYIGHPVCEIGAMIRNPWDAFPSKDPLSKTIDRRIQILSEELKFDIQLINAWALCFIALSESWSLEDKGSSHKINLELLSILEKRVS